MSRGPGRWQRAILQAVATKPGEWITTDDLLCAHPTHSEREAVRRAMHRLAELGQVELAHLDVMAKRHFGGAQFERIRPGGISGWGHRRTLAVRTVNHGE